MTMTTHDLRLDSQLNLDHVEHVVSIVSSSRAGSSLLKHTMALHSDLSTLAGEEEPYYKLAHNGYPWHTCDVFHSLNGLDYVRLLMANELHNHQQQHNRAWIQSQTVEEPPFVQPKQCRLTPTLLLKTPQNIYRRGVLEELFPGRRISYIYLTRGFAQVVNGLIDGWLSDDYKARKTEQGWWKFDMPPGWAFSHLYQRCYHQWRMANLFGLGEYDDASYRLKFEDFTRDTDSVCQRLYRLLGLPPHSVPPLEDLPHIMATSAPKPHRWQGRAYLAKLLGSRAEPLMTNLGYSMDQSTWT